MVRPLRSFLARLRGRPAPDHAPQAPAPLLPLLQLRILTAADQRLVEVDDRGQRITELLNSGGDIRVRDVSVEGEASSGSEPWTQFDADVVLVVVPPAQTTDRLRRLHRPGQQVRVQVGPYVVTGAAHVPAGAEATAFLLRHRPRFVPLTGATIRRVDGGQDDVSVPVAIVNLRMADSLRTGSAAL